MNQREFAEALETASESIGLARRHLTGQTDVPMKSMLANSLTVAADASDQLGRTDDSDRAFREGGEAHRALLALDASRFMEAAVNHAKAQFEFLKNRDRPDEAEAIRRQALSDLDRAIEPLAAGVPERRRLERMRKSFEKLAPH